MIFERDIVPDHRGGFTIRQARVTAMGVRYVFVTDVTGVPFPTLFHAQAALERLTLAQPLVLPAADFTATPERIHP